MTNKIFFSNATPVSIHPLLKFALAIVFLFGFSTVTSCHYGVRVVYNPTIRDQPLDGLDAILSDQEQIRIRNRVQQLLMQYQCDRGKSEALEALKKPAPYSESN